MTTSISDDEAERKACRAARDLLRALATDLEDNDSTSLRSRIAIVAAHLTGGVVLPQDRPYLKKLEPTLWFPDG